MTEHVTCLPCDEMIPREPDDELISNMIGNDKNHGHELGEGNRSEILAGAQEA